MKGKLGCGVITAILAINCVLGTWSVLQILSWFGKSIPILGALIIGLFAGEISIPVAIVGYILKLFGIF